MQILSTMLQPTGATFRNSAQQVSVLEFLSARSDRQREAFMKIKDAVEAYDVECIDTLIGDIVPPAELMKTQTDRKIAEELERTYEVQREAQVQRQALERETAVANMQNEVVRSEQTVRISQQTALSAAESARGEGNAARLRAEGHAAAVRLNGEAEAAAGSAVVRPGRRLQGMDAVGGAGYTAIQLATILGEHNVKLVPEIAVSGDGSGGLINAMVAKMLAEK
jgi:uncharacterized membrane protein YqiK